MMKKIYFGLLITLIISLSFIPNVNAEVNYDYEFEITKRTYADLPFSNWYAAGEVATYDNRNFVKIYGTNENLTNMPRYLYLIYCGTGTINFETTSVSTGDISNDGATWGSSCTLANGYQGTYRLNRWTIKEWGDLSSSNIYQWGVVWSVRVHNTLGHNVYIDMESVFLSNELIQDFSSDALLTEILAQNSSLKSSLNNIQSSSDETNSKLNDIQSSSDETNNKLNETNKELGEINDNITNDNVDDATSSAGDFFSGFESDTFGLTSIITAPLNLISSITSSSCSPLGLKLPFVDNATLNLPCMTTIYENYFGSFLNVYQVITFGITAYWVCIRIFNLVKDFKNPDRDEVEVLDL